MGNQVTLIAVEVLILPPRIQNATTHTPVCSSVQGCKGGNIVQAYEYVVANQGLDSDEDYPYIAADYDPCWTQAAKRHVTAISNWTVLPKGSEPALQAAASITPVAVAIDASDDIFQHYKSGTLSGKCGTKRKDRIPLSVSQVMIL
jgi:hypothetical protein